MMRRMTTMRMATKILALALLAGSLATAAGCKDGKGAGQAKDQAPATPRGPKPLLTREYMRRHA